MTKLPTKTSKRLNRASIKEGRIDPASELQTHLDALQRIVRTLHQQGPQGMQVIAAMNQSLGPFIDKVIARAKVAPSTQPQQLEGAAIVARERKNPPMYSNENPELLNKVKEAVRMVTFDDPNTVFGFYKLLRALKHEKEYTDVFKDESQYYTEVADHFIDQMTSLDGISPNDGQTPRMTPDEFKNDSQVEIGKAVIQHFSK